MANEIIITTGLTVKNPSTTGALASFTIPAEATSITQATAAPCSVGGTQTIGFAAHEALTLTDLTTIGWAYLRNRDAANYVQIGVDVGGTFYPLVTLEAGEKAVFRFAAGVTPYAQANTAAVILERLILDD